MSSLSFSLGVLGYLLWPSVAGGGG